VDTVYLNEFEFGRASIGTHSVHTDTRPC